MLDNPHTLISDRHTKSLTPEEKADKLICHDCFHREPAPHLSIELATFHVRLPTRDIYLCADHLDERRAKDAREREIDHALSQAFSAGSYAQGYVSEDLNTAWEAEIEDNEDSPLIQDAHTSGPYRAAFLIGFFASHGPSEFPSGEDGEDDPKTEHDEAVRSWGQRMAQIGIAVDLDYCEQCDGFVSPDHLEEDPGHTIDTVGKADPMPGRPVDYATT